jgi:MFS family permease
MRWRRTGLWQHPDFVKLWTGQTISQIGSHITGTALPLAAALTLGATPLQMGLLAATGIAPALLIGLPAGVWVDRLRRRPLLIGADLGRALLLATIPLAALFGALGMAQLYVVGVLTSLLSVCFDVANRSYLPALVERGRLVEGNSKLAASSSLAEIGGPSLGGALVQLITAPFAVAFDALSFLVSAAAIALIRTPEPPPHRQAGQRLSGAIGEGLAVVWRDPILRALTGSAAIARFFGSAFHTLYVLYLVNELHLPPVIVGVSIGVGGVGALIGAGLAERFTRRVGLGPALIASLLWATAPQMIIPLMAGSPAFVSGLLLATQLVGDVAWSVYFINEISLRQAITPDRLLGRMNASVDVVVGAVGLVGVIGAGALAEVIGMRATLLIGALGLILAATPLIRSALPRLREAPALDPALPSG